MAVVSGTAMSRIIREGYEHRVRVRNSPDIELSADDLRYKREMIAEEERFNAKYGAEFDRIFGSS